MGKQSALRFDPGRDAIEPFLRKLNEMGKSEKTIENMIARDLSRSAADRLVPLVQRAVMSSPAPQARAVAATVRSKRDRMIVVQAGVTNPALSGWKRSASGKVWRGSVAWGVAVGGWSRQSQSVNGGRVKSHRRGSSRVKAYQRGPFEREQGNVYRVGRRGGPPDPFSGYMSGWKERIREQAAEEYADIILEIVRRNGWPVEVT